MKKIIYAFGTVADANLLSEIALQLSRYIDIDHVPNAYTLLSYMKKLVVKPAMIVLDGSPDIPSIVRSVWQEPGLREIPFVIFLDDHQLSERSRELRDTRIILLPKPRLPSELKYYFKRVLDTVGIYTEQMVSSTDDPRS